MRSARSKIGLLAALAALIASIAWMAHRREEASLAAVARDPLPDATEESVERGAAISDLELTDSAPPPQVSNRAAVAGPRSPSGANGPRVVLKGKIESSCPNLERGSVRVRFSITGSEHFEDLLGYEARAYLRRDGTFEADVSKLVFLRDHAAELAMADSGETREQIRAHPQVLVVEVGHTDLGTAHVEVPLGDPERWRGERYVELSTVIAMPWRHVTLVGSASSVEHGVEWIEVAALRLEEGRPSSAPEAAVLARAGERFRIDLGKPGEFLVVAHAAQCRPSSVRATVAAEGDFDVGHLELARGASVRGRVTSADHSGIAGVAVYATPRAQPSRIDTSPPLVWNGETVEWASRSARTDENGAYEIAQLRPGGYSLSFLDLPSSNFGGAPSLQVTAPAADADLVVGADACEIHLVVFVAGRPGRASFTVHQTRGGSTSRAALKSADDGNATLYVDPQATSTVEVGDHTFPVPDCTAGRITEMRIDLEKRE